MSAQRTLLVVGLGLLLAGTGMAVYGITSSGDEGQGPAAEDDNRQQDVAPLEDPSLLNQLPGGDGERMRSSTVVVFAAEWSECDEGPQAYRQPAGETMQGMTEEALAEAFPEWDIAVFQVDRVELTRTLAGDCPDTFTITIRDGYVVVLAGDDRDGPVVMHTRLAEEELLAGDRTVLAEGITVVGRDEVWYYLEGIREHGADP